MSRFFSALGICGLVTMLTACASTGVRTDNAESTAAEGSLPEAEGWSLEEDTEPLPILADAAPQEDLLLARDFDLARPTEPRNPYDSLQYRQYRRIVPPAQR